MNFFLITLSLLTVLPVFAQQKNPYKPTPLIQAINDNDLAKAETLLKSGADVNSLGTWIYTPLEVAIHQRKADIVELFLRYKGNPNLPNSSTILPMDLAIQVQDLAIVDLLFKSGADLNLLSSDLTFVELACKSLRDFGSEEQLLFQSQSYEFLIKNGFDFNKNKNSFANILEACAGSAKKEIVKDLFTKADFKSAVNTLNYVGSTALLAAVASYHYEHDALEIVKILLENGANPNLKGQDGRSPLNSAKAYKRKKIERVLIDAGAKP